MLSHRLNLRWSQILVALLALSSLAAAQSNPLFSTLSLNPVGSQPVAIASGDFNGDGFPDRAVVNSGNNSVSILLGTGDGNFQPAVNYTVGGFPTAIVAGDFNHDGHLDLAVANYGAVVGAGSVSILLGRGDGTFVGGATYPITYDPVAIVAGDLDGDGNLDLAVLIVILLLPGFTSIFCVVVAMAALKLGPISWQALVLAQDTWQLAILPGMGDSIWSSSRPR